MEVFHPICCGIDVHKKSIVACLIMNGQKNLQTFGTMTEDLLAMLDWLLKSECHHVAPWRVQVHTGSRFTTSSNQPT